MIEYRNKTIPNIWLKLNNLDGLDMEKEFRWRDFLIDGQIFTEHTKEFDHAILLEKLRD